MTSALNCPLRINEVEQDDLTMGQITVRIPDGDKEEVKQIIRERRVPLDFSLDTLPAETKKALVESMQMAKDDKAEVYESGTDLINAMSTGKEREP